MKKKEKLKNIVDLTPKDTIGPVNLAASSLFKIKGTDLGDPGTNSVTCNCVLMEGVNGTCRWWQCKCQTSNGVVYASVFNCGQGFVALL